MLSHSVKSKVNISLFVRFVIFISSVVQVYYVIHTRKCLTELNWGHDACSKEKQFVPEKITETGKNMFEIEKKI